MLRHIGDLSRVYSTTCLMVARIDSSPSTALIRISGWEWMDGYLTVTLSSRMEIVRLSVFLCKCRGSYQKRWEKENVIILTCTKRALPLSTKMEASLYYGLFRFLSTIWKNCYLLFWWIFPCKMSVQNGKMWTKALFFDLTRLSPKVDI